MTEPLTAESILDTAEEVLRRFGPAKTTVVDVARALDRHLIATGICDDAKTSLDQREVLAVLPE